MILSLQIMLYVYFFLFIRRDDTVSEHVQNSSRVKLDLRVIVISENDMASLNNTGHAEFRIEVMPYKDKTKCILSSKSLINYLLKLDPNMPEEFQEKLSIQFLIVIGFETHLLP